MKISDFKDNTTGLLVPTISGYQAFVPSMPPLDLVLDTPTELALFKADAALGELSGLGRYLPNPDLLIAPYVKRAINSAP